MSFIGLPTHPDNLIFWTYPNATEALAYLTVGQWRRDQFIVRLGMSHERYFFNDASVIGTLWSQGRTRFKWVELQAVLEKMWQKLTMTQAFAYFQLQNMRPNARLFMQLDNSDSKHVMIGMTVLDDILPANYRSTSSRRWRGCLTEDSYILDSVSSIYGPHYSSPRIPFMDPSSATVMCRYLDTVILNELRTGTPRKRRTRLRRAMQKERFSDKEFVIDYQAGKHLHEDRLSNVEAAY